MSQINMLAFLKKIKNRLDAVINQTSCLFFFLNGLVIMHKPQGNEVMPKKAKSKRGF